MMRMVKRGFSLIEVLVAMTIISIIMASVYFSFGNLLNGRERMKNRIEGLRKIYFALDIIKKDIKNAYLTTHKGAPEETHVTVFKGEEDDPVSHLTFSTLTHIPMKANAKECDQAEVEYYGDEVDGVITLFRRESLWVDEFPDRGGNVYPLLDGFQYLKLEYWDEEDTEWISRWSSESVERADKLPPKVKITLMVREEEDNKKEFKIETVVALKMVKPYTN